MFYKFGEKGRREMIGWGVCVLALALADRYLLKTQGHHAFRTW
ncbi:hypothetical protein ACP0HM_30325 [Escherichia coli]